MKKNTIYICLAILFLNVQCSKNEVLLTPFPLIESISILSITGFGVEFNATIKNENKSKIIEYGFIWGEPNDNLTYEAGEKLVVGTDLSEEGFSYKLTYGMLDNENYKVRAYLKTKDKTLLSHPYHFTSKGSSLTKLINIIPNTGTAGDTIKLIGENFSTIAFNNSVTIGYNRKATIVKSTDSEITFIVPAGSNNDGRNKNKLKLTVFGQTIESIFTISSPKINSITPLIGTFRDEIIIHGENFSYIDKYNIVYFNDVLAENVISVDKNTIKVKVPTNIQRKNTNIRVSIENYGTVFNQQFILITPKINSISQGPLFVGKTITITGANFNPVLNNNKVNFEGPGGNSGEVISGSVSHLIVKVPEGPYIRRETLISVNSKEIVYKNNFKREIGDKWVLRSKPYYTFDRKEFTNNVVVANNIPIFAHKRSNQTTTMNRINPNDYEIYYSYSNVSENEVNYNGIVSTLSDGKDAYIYNHTNKNFWKYNEEYNTFSNSKNFPGTERENVTQFTINGEIYLGFGKSSNTYFNDMYKYSPQNDNWTQVSSNPSNTKRDNTAVFVIEDVAYMIGGATDSNSKDCWAYYSNTDTWVRIADYPHSINGAAAFTLDGEGYVTAGKIIGGNIINEVWKYNPINNNWTQSENVGLKPRYNHAAFSLNGKGYVLGGIIDESNVAQYKSDVYEFIK